MSIALRYLLLTLSVLLIVSTQLCWASSQDWNSTDECQPDIPQPLPDANETMITLQIHQWVWIERLNSSDAAPRTDSGGMFYEFLRPGFVRHLRLPLITYLRDREDVYVNVSYVTNGETLCTSALTEYRNKTTGNIDTVSCNKKCHANFTQLGAQANQPLLVLDDWRLLNRKSEYLAFDAVDPETRASYKCMGHFKFQPIWSLSYLMSRVTQCSEGDVCLFNYDTTRRLVDGGCKSDFNIYNWCVNDIELCSYNMNGDCPVCCRGDLCNYEPAQKVYKRWLGNGAENSSNASSLWMLMVCTIGLLGLRIKL